MPTAWLPCPGNTNAIFDMLALLPPDYQRTTALPHVMPAPMAIIATTSPCFSRPARLASSSVIGMDAEDVLP